MTGTVTTDRPSVAKSVSRPQFQKVRERQRVGTGAAPRLQPVTYIGKLEAEGVIQRQGCGFPLHQSRVAYLRTCGASGNNRRARRPMPHTSRSRPGCCNCG